MAQEATASKEAIALVASQFGGYLIRLDAISETYLGLSPSTASAEASQGRLPLRVFKLRPSKDAPWVTTAALLAAHLETLGQKEIAAASALSATNLLHDIRTGRRA